MEHPEDTVKGMGSAARYLNVSLGEVARLMRKGLPYAKINGLACFSREDLDDFIEGPAHEFLRETVAPVPESGRETPNQLVNRSGPGDTMDFGTPEQLAEMPMPQPLSKVAAARRKIDKDKC